ncbi:cytochrome c biogenesis protein ResB [Candidatus Sumerlaeota bacterium]|nr:cytochrome c biogenesis protein ResB [Candidatus Sumerlaeota bacterium]
MLRLPPVRNPLFRKLSSVRVGLVFLAALALVCVLGTFLPGEESMRLVFGTGWFAALLGLNAVSIACATYRHLSETIPLDDRPVFFRGPEDYGNLRVNDSIASARGEADLDAVETVLRSLGYRAVRREKGAISALAGRCQHWGSVVAHLGVILILVGAAIDLAMGVRGEVVLREGESTDRYFTEESGPDGKPLGFELRLIDFETTLHPNSSVPDKFISTVEILDGPTHLRREVEVNRAQRYGGFVLHQNSYEPAPEISRYVLDLRDARSPTPRPIYVEANVGEPIDVPGAPGYTLSLEETGQTVQCAIREPGGAVFAHDLSATPSEMSARLAADEPKGRFHVERWEKIEAYYSVLGVMRHPGIPAIYLGCLLMIAGPTISFAVRRRRFWALWSEETGRIYLGGRSRYATSHLERDVAEIVKAIRKGATENA